MRPATGVTCMLLAIAAGLTLVGCGDEEEIATCSSDEDCRNGYYCDPSSKTCKPKGSDAKIDVARDFGIDVPVKSDMIADKAPAEKALMDQAPPDQSIDHYVHDQYVHDQYVHDQYVHDQYVHDQYVHDQYVHDQLKPDLFKPNGTTCSSASECISGYCSGNVCCDKACTGVCETCTATSSVGTCKPLAKGTACGASPSCTGSTLVTNACDGTSSTCQTTSTLCDPYYCNSSGTACATSCTKSSECSSYLCDPFDTLGTKGKCQPTSSVCYVHKTGTCGGGTMASPACFIQICLDKSPAPKYVAIIEGGTYKENLTIKSNVALVATDSTAPLLVNYVKQTSALKVFLEPTDPAKGLIDDTLGYDLLIYGVGIRPPATGTYDKMMVNVKAGATAPKVEIRTCSIENPVFLSTAAYAVNIFSVNAFTAPIISISDVEVGGGCKGIYIDYSDISLQNVHVTIAGKQSITGCQNGLQISHSKAKIRDLLTDNNYFDGLNVNASVIDIDRWISTGNTYGGFFTGSSSGTVANALVVKNTKGITIGGSSTPTFLNVTVADNVGGTTGSISQVDCLTGTVNFWNSIIYDKTAGAVVFNTNCAFYYSLIYCNPSCSPLPTGSNNLDSIPEFLITGDNPYSLETTSPCVDHGQDTVTGFNPYPTKDVIGNNRKVDKFPAKPAIVDCGAYELQ